ncbi:MAG: hypothetical protein HUU50_07900 [Candidatus Brocadiae bacterium]|nr:hypothetical protein [Candidatus Brocadiia bacterium]
MKHYYIFFALVFALLAQAQTFEPIGLEGLQILSLGIDSEENLYASTMQGLFFLEHGKAWKKVDIQETVLAIAFSKAGKIIAGTLQKGLAYSMDKGKTWEYTPLSEKPIRALAVYQESMYVGTQEGKIYQSQGEKWTEIASLSGSVLSLFADSKNLYAGVISEKDNGVIYFSQDAGKTWENRILGKILPKRIDAHSSLIYLSTNHGMHFSTDAGLSWKYAGLKDSIQDFILLSQKRVLAGTKEGLFVLSQDGKLWVRIGKPIDISAMTLDAKGNLYLGTHHGGVYQSQKSFFSLEEILSIEEIISVRDIGRILIQSWDVGGGNFFYPKAKVRVGISGKTAHCVKMFSVTSDWYMKELQAFYCSDGCNYYFNSQYFRATTRWLEFRLYDNMGYVIAREVREAK